MPSILNLGDQMIQTFGAIYHILLKYESGIWTIKLLRIISSLRNGEVGEIVVIHGRLARFVQKIACYS